MSNRGLLVVNANDLDYNSVIFNDKVSSKQQKV
jgi:hypothetical protein